ncbi:hypothetical protein [Thalassospira sp.]|uniref:hypothetical protein n=1 Tax=Thalassospira sp. TaxID=1912094 RepID=UPI0032EC5564
MIDQLTDKLTELAKAAAARLAVFAVIGLVILIGIGFLLAAAFMAVAAKFGAIAAAVAFGTGLIVLALVALAIMMQRDPGEGIEKPKAGSDPKATRSDDDVVFDLLIHAATAGYATGQGNNPGMQTGLERMVDDLNALGVFDRPKPRPEPDDDPEKDPDDETKKAGS